MSVILNIDNVTKRYRKEGGLFSSGGRLFTAVDGVSLALEKNTTLGIVGESGSGKTTLAKLILGIEKPDSGRVTLDGKELSSLSGGALRRARRGAQMVFQDPYSSLNPRMKVIDIVLEPLRAAGEKVADGEKTAAALLERVGLKPDALLRYPHEFSGGQRQRVAIARALATGPGMILADEPISSLDISIQAQIMNLLNQLKKELGISYIFISHDLAAVRYLCDFVAVMYRGCVVEYAPAAELFRDTRHPYTRLLLSAVPDPDPSRKTVLEERRDGSAGPEPQACVFSDRCPRASEVCLKKRPDYEETSPGHFVRCARVDDRAN
ncbi:MAG: ATP-binding cassette domain-containing protein [Elusimicrobiales bacterium]|nr:ATP-binding cassette domain-containing protein [Elusimicrobiales bacterium]